MSVDYMWKVVKLNSSENENAHVSNLMRVDGGENST